MNFEPTRTNPFKEKQFMSRSNLRRKLSITALVFILPIVIICKMYVQSKDAQTLATASEAVEDVAAFDSNSSNNLHPTRSIVDPLAVSLESLTIVSMNLAACEPSQSAPWGWEQQNSTEAVRSEILKSNPDIVALQECPGGVEWAARLFPSYQVLGVAHSHADQVILLVKEGISAIPVQLRRDMPGVMAQLQWNNRSLLFASVHLAPFKTGNRTRRLQVEYILQKAISMPLPLVFAGDMNMRPDEDYTMESELQLVDVWKLAGSDNETKFTWDTIDHRDEGGFFNQYYGRDTRQYNARYDRIYVSTLDRFDIERPKFELIANQPLNDGLQFLSDHFGILSRLRFQWKK